MKRAFPIWLLLTIMLLSDAPADQELPFLSLTAQEQNQAIHVTKKAIRWWLERKYSDLYSVYSTAGNFLTDENISRVDRKARFIKWCAAWRERNPYNSRLSEREVIERLRTVDVNLRMLTGFVLMHMKPSYWDALTKGTWHHEMKLAFVEFHIRGRRYLQPLIREGREWKIITIPLTFDEHAIREYEGVQRHGGAKAKSRIK